MKNISLASYIVNTVTVLFIFTQVACVPSSLDEGEYVIPLSTVIAGGNFYKCQNIGETSYKSDFILERIAEESEPYMSIRAEDALERLSKNKVRVCRLPKQIKYEDCGGYGALGCYTNYYIYFEIWVARDESLVHELMHHFIDVCYDEYNNRTKNTNHSHILQAKVQPLIESEFNEY